MPHLTLQMEPFVDRSCRNGSDQGDTDARLHAGKGNPHQNFSALVEDPTAPRELLRTHTGPLWQWRDRCRPCFREARLPPCSLVLGPSAFPAESRANTWHSPSPLSCKQCSHLCSRAVTKVTYGCATGRESPAVDEELELFVLQQAEMTSEPNNNGAAMQKKMQSSVQSTTVVYLPLPYRFHHGKRLPLGPLHACKIR